jgi:hypothetical protein
MKAVNSLWVPIRKLQRALSGRKLLAASGCMPAAVVCRMASHLSLLKVSPLA